MSSNLIARAKEARLVGLRINTVLSMRANTQLQRTQKAIARSLERLSSGQRVNSPRDDAAAYRLGVGLTSQIRGIAAANLGINTALGMVETADAVVSSQIEIVQRMREIAVQASNGALSNTDRSNLNQEVQSLYAEYERLATQSNFNGANLLDGSFGLKTIQLGASKGDSYQFGISSTTASAVFVQRTTVGTGTFQARATYGVGSNSSYVKTYDLNGDGKLDLIDSDSTSNTVSVLLGNGNGTFSARTTLAAGIIPRDISIADLDGDGNVDLVVNDFSGLNISIFRGNGNGTFLARSALPVSNNTSGNFVGDFNGDGKLDIAASEDGIVIFLGNGNGTFTSRTTTGAGSGPYDITGLDINGDGKVDLVTVDGTTSATMSIYIGNGNGTFAARVTVATGTMPVRILSADFNGDGKVDLATTDEGDNMISVILSNGNGTFAQRKTVRTDSGPIELTAVDLNGDGKLDLINTNNFDNTVTIFLANGNGTFLSPTRAYTGNAPQSVIAGDFNGDSVVDLAVGDYSDTSVSILLGNSTNVSSAATVSVASQTNATNLIAVLDGALSSLGSARANFAAIHSRLNESLAGNLLLSENLGAAKSVALDADFAMETAELVRNQILQLAQIAVLTQANLNQQLLLKLLDPNS